MKKRLVHIFVICLLVLTTSGCQAYWWRFNNFTNKILLLRVTLLAHNSPHYALVFPSMSALFNWSPPHPLAGFCFGTIQWTTVPDEILNNRELITDDNKIISNNKIERLFFGNNAQFALNKASIDYFSSELYKKTVKYASTFSGKALLKWAARQHARSKCRSRHIFIVEDEDGKIKFLAQKS